MCIKHLIFQLNMVLEVKSQCEQEEKDLAFVDDYENDPYKY